MNSPIQKPQRNQSIECCRLMASIAVIFIHITFPGQLGSGVNCLARLAVPFFFAVSGYFAWDAAPEKILKRAGHTLKLYLVGIALALFWGVFCQGVLLDAPVLPWLLERINAKSLAQWFVLNGDTIGGGHLWYLISLLMCYLVLYVYVSWSGAKYRNLYFFALAMLLLEVVLDSFASAAGMPLPNSLYRNALLLGLPLFTLGLFLREHQAQLRQRFCLTNRRLLLLILTGVLMSVLQWMVYGEHELPLGTLLQVFALILLTTSTPSIAKQDSLAARMIAHFGSLSTFVYITHLIWGEVYTQFFSGMVAAGLGTWESYIRPLLAAAMTLAMGIAWEVMKGIAGRISR